MTSPQTPPATSPEAPFPGRWAGLGVLSLSLLVVMMDMTILTVALPDLARDLQPSSVQGLWIVDVYALVVAGLLVTASALGDRIGRRRLLLGGYAVFGGASSLVLIADSPAALIAVRALLGVGGAMIMPATLSMIRTMFTDDRERGTALGIWASVAGVGGAIGPMIGGALLEAFSWQSAFLLNVPLMAVAFVAGARLLPESRPARPARIDVPAVALSIAGAGLLMYAIKDLGKHGVGPAPLLFLATSLLLLRAFARRSLRAADPMLEIRLLASARFRGGVVTALATMIAMGGLMLLAVQWLQLSQGLSPLESGLVLMPMALASVVSSITLPGLAERFGQRICMTGGLLVGALGMVIPALAPGGLSIGVLIANFALLGLGMGSLAVASGVIMSDTPTEKAGSAAAIEETSYELGMALSVAILGSVGLAVYRAGLPESAGDVARESLAGALAQAGGGRGGLGDAFVLQAGDAFAHGLVVAGLVGAAILVASAGVVWRSMRERGPAGVARRGRPADGGSEQESVATAVS